MKFSKNLGRGDCSSQSPSFYGSELLLTFFRNIPQFNRITQQNFLLFIILPSVFEKHKICSNRTKSLLIVNFTNIIRKNNEDFAMERRSTIYFTSPFYLQCYKP